MFPESRTPVTLTAGQSTTFTVNLCPDIRGHVPRNCDGDVERIEPELVDTV